MALLGVVMPFTRSNKPSADAAATQEPAAPPSTQDISKRQRKRPTLFEQGENPLPSTARNKRPKKRARVEPEPLEAAEASQSAAETQTGDIVFGEGVITGQGVEDKDNDLEESVDRAQRMRKLSLPSLVLSAMEESLGKILKLLQV